MIAVGLAVKTGKVYAKQLTLWKHVLRDDFTLFSGDGVSRPVQVAIGPDPVRIAVHLTLDFVDKVYDKLTLHPARNLPKVTGKVVLRRTKDVIRGSLPPALEVVIFCRPSQQQLSLYQRCISSSEARVLLCNDDEEENSGEDRNGFSSESDEAGKSSGKRTEKQRQRSKRSRPQRAITLQGVLPLISTLRRLCNHPDLVDEKYTSDVGDGDGCGENFGSSDESLKGMVNFDDDDWRYRLLKNEEAERDSEGQETAAGDTLGKENTLPNAVSDGLGRGAKGATSGFKAPRLSGARDSTAIETPQVATAVETTRDSAARSVNRTQQYDSQASGKVLVLQELLMAVRRDCPDDKVRSSRESKQCTLRVSIPWKLCQT